jgi:arylsulfatase A-like enzyme
VQDNSAVNYPIGSLGWLVNATFSGSYSLRAASKNNFQLTVDQRYGDISNLDRLRREGVRITDFHVSPNCSPTLGVLSTGVAMNSRMAFLIQFGSVNGLKQFAGSPTSKDLNE